jgi:hypothetical protein
MTTDERNTVVNYIEGLAARANQTGPMAGCYLACLAGMYADVIHLKNAPEFVDNMRYRYYLTGVDASIAARQSVV